MQRNGRKAVKLTKEGVRGDCTKNTVGLVVRDWRLEISNNFEATRTNNWHTKTKTDSILQKKTLRIGSVSNYRHYTMESLILAQDER